MSVTPAPSDGPDPASGAVTGAGEGTTPETSLAPPDEPEPASALVPDAGAPDAGPHGVEPRPLDLLFVVDNSISMADKQQLLRQVSDVLGPRKASSSGKPARTRARRPSASAIC